MGFIVDDSDLPCTASGLGGVFVPESAQILEVCQDPDNLGIIYIITTIKGVYQYTPTLEVTWGSETVNVDSLYVPNYKGEGAAFPIDVKCGSKTVTLAYNVGNVIPNFKTVNMIDLELKFIGSADGIGETEFIQEIFQSSDPAVSYTFVKGLSPTPYKVYFDPNSEKLKVQFVNLGDKPCACAIDCVVPTQEDLDIAVCKDEAQEVTINKNLIVGDPTKATITFVDSIGNQSDIDLQLMNSVKPLRPQAFAHADPYHAKVSINYVSENGATLNPDKIMYQVFKYEGTPNSARIWKDWSDQPVTSFVDTEVRHGYTYGYGVRFKGEFGELSDMSSWSTVKIV
jgi:hypothetical protein